MFIYGGYVESQHRFCSDVYNLNLKTMKWRIMEARGESPRYRDFHTSTGTKNKLKWSTISRIPHLEFKSLSIFFSIFQPLVTRSLCSAVGAAQSICTFPRENSTATKWCVSTSRLATGPGWQRCQTNPIRTAMECPKADDLTRHSTSKAASLSLEDSIPGVLNELLKDDLSYCELWFLFQFQNWPAQERPLGVQSWQ